MTTEDEVLRWLVGRFGLTEATAILDELQLTGDSLPTLEALKEASERLPVPPVPAELTERLIALFDHRDTRHYELVAVGASSAPAAERGLRDGDDGRIHLTCEVADVLVDVVRQSGDVRTVEVQVLSDTLSVPGLVVSLSGPVSRGSPGDSLGRFVVPDMPAGDYRLLVSSPNAVLVGDVSLDWA